MFSRNLPLSLSHSFSFSLSLSIFLIRSFSLDFGCRAECGSFVILFYPFLINSFAAQNQSVEGGACWEQERDYTWTKKERWWTKREKSKDMKFDGFVLVFICSVITHLSNKLLLLLLRFAMSFVCLFQQTILNATNRPNWKKILFFPWKWTVCVSMIWARIGSTDTFRHVRLWIKKVIVEPFVKIFK